MHDFAVPAPQPEVAAFLRAVADETRLAIVRLLMVGDLRSGEIGERLRLPTNALAYHFRQLRAAGLLRERRSSADARDVYHRLDLDRLAALYAEAGDLLHPGLGSSSADSIREQATEDTQMAALSRPLRVLFLCTHNSARSQLAEALMRQMGGDQVDVYSAGSLPTEVYPDTLRVLRELGIDGSALYAKSLDRFLSERFDYVITVCDRVREICPAFTGDPNQAHWSFPDLVVVEGPERRLKAFRQVASELQTRIRYLLLLPHPATGERLRTHGSWP